MVFLAQRRGYSLVGVNSAGVNAFFVREDLLSDRCVQRSVQDIYRPSNFREGRDEFGNLSYVASGERLEIIRGLPVLNVETGQLETL